VGLVALVALVALAAFMDLVAFAALVALVAMVLTPLWAGRVRPGRLCSVLATPWVWHKWR
jgi:hypothetical protein